MPSVTSPLPASQTAASPVAGLGAASDTENANGQVPRVDGRMMDTMAGLTAGLDDEGGKVLAQAVQWLRQHGNISNDGNGSSHSASTGTILGTGEPLNAHCVGTALILAQLGVDAQTRASALLSALPATEKNLEALHAAFGRSVAELVQGVHALLKLDQIADLGHAAGSASAKDPQSPSHNDQQTEMRRKMMLAMAADLRIVLLRLASRLQSLRWYASSRTPCPQAYARQTLEVYTPLANRLGIWQLKWEMEDLALRFLQPDVYRRIARQLEDKRGERQALIARMVKRLQQALADAGMAASVSGRPKHIYSIWNKMRNKQLDFDQLFDLRALRVIVADERSCYAVLALVHALWTPVSEEFDDYIARPKANGYRSLHTVVTDAQGRVFEIQIRTQEMHAFAEYGLAAHWRYKEGGGQSDRAGQAGEAAYHKKIAWMRRLLGWEQQAAAPSSIPEAQPQPPARSKEPASQRAHLQADERIYVMTPQARVIELPARATPVDFAYAVHTELGHRCRGARVDGHMVPLHTPLKTGQMVEIISAKSGGPSRDWLNPQAGYLASHRARTKVRAWFNAIELQARMAQGQALIDKELQRQGKTAVNRENLAHQLGFAKVDDLYVAVAKDEFSLRHVEAALRGGGGHALLREGASQGGGQAEEATPAACAPQGFFTPRTSRAAPASAKGVLVMGVDALMTQLARCCRPAPPDAVGGFITRGRGVSVHRQTCSNYRALVAKHPERDIAVAWGQPQGMDDSAGSPVASPNAGPAVYPVDISIHARQHPNLLRELSEVFSRLRLNVVSVNTHSRGSLAHMVFTVEVRDGAHMEQALKTLNALAHVTARRR